MAQEKKSKGKHPTNGIIKENPVLRLVLGTCSTLLSPPPCPVLWAWALRSPSCWCAPIS